MQLKWALILAANTAWIARASLGDVHLGERLKESFEGTVENAREEVKHLKESFSKDDEEDEDEDVLDWSEAEQEIGGLLPDIFSIDEDLLKSLNESLNESWDEKQERVNDQDSDIDEWNSDQGVDEDDDEQGDGEHKQPLKDLTEKARDSLDNLFDKAKNEEDEKLLENVWHNVKEIEENAVEALKEREEQLIENFEERREENEDDDGESERLELFDIISDLAADPDFNFNQWPDEDQVEEELRERYDWWDDLNTEDQEELIISVTLIATLASLCSCCCCLLVCSGYLCVSCIYCKDFKRNKRVNNKVRQALNAQQARLWRAETNQQAYMSGRFAPQQQVQLPQASFPVSRDPQSLNSAETQEPVYAWQKRESRGGSPNKSQYDTSMDTSIDSERNSLV